MDLLVVEDDLTSREALVRLLQSEGFKVGAAANGREALEQIEKAHPRVIVLDLWMPVMDGSTFLRQLRTLPGAASRIPVIIFTADMREQARGAFHEVVLEKPLDLPLLLGAVRAELERSNLQPHD